MQSEYYTLPAPDQQSKIDLMWCVSGLFMATGIAVLIAGLVAYCPN